MSLYDAREHVRTIGGCPSRHDPEPTGTPVSPPPHLSVFTHFGIWLPLGGNHIPKWRNLVGLGGGLFGDGGGSSFNRRHIAQVLSTRHRHIVVERVTLRSAGRNVQFSNIGFGDSLEVHHEGS